jgi:hypothetical protein
VVYFFTRLLIGQLYGISLDSCLIQLISWNVSLVVSIYRKKRIFVE